MSQLREIRQQIASIGQTRQITQAMQRIAFIKMRRAKERALTLRPYSRHLNRIVARLMALETDVRPALLASRLPAHRIGMIVVTTDKGLCGSLNTRLLHMAVTQLDSWQRAGREVSVTAIGARGLGVLRRAGARIVAQAVHVGEFGTGDADALMGAIAVPLHQFIDGEIDALFVATNRFVNSLQHEPVLARFLPFSPEMLELPAPGSSVDYLYEPEPGPVIDAALMRYVETVIFRAIAENAACEQSARMTAMKAATENASRMIDELTVKYNKRRQEAITNELEEIIAGADALRGRATEVAEERPVPGAGKPFRLEVATLNGELFSGAVTYVEVPGEGGHLGVLHGHTPLLTQVAPGALNFHTAGGEARTLQVLGGIVEVAPWGVAVLADLAGRDAEAEEARMARARQSAAAHVPHAERAIGAAAVRAELDAELVRFFATALRKQPRR